MNLRRLLRQSGLPPGAAPGAQSRRGHQCLEASDLQRSGLRLSGHALRGDASGRRRAQSACEHRHGVENGECRKPSTTGHSAAAAPVAASSASRRSTADLTTSGSTRRAVCCGRSSASTAARSPGDVTRGRAAEQQLRAAEERFRLLVESATDFVIFFIDPRGASSSGIPAESACSGGARSKYSGNRSMCFSRRRSGPHACRSRSSRRPCAAAELWTSGGTCARTARDSLRAGALAREERARRGERLRQDHARHDRAQARRGPADDRDGGRGAGARRGAAGQSLEGRVHRHRQSRAAYAAQCDPPLGTPLGVRQAPRPRNRTAASRP